MLYVFQSCFLEDGAQFKFLRFLHTHLESPNSKDVVHWVNKAHDEFEIKNVIKWYE